MLLRDVSRDKPSINQENAYLDISDTKFNFLIKKMNCVVPENIHTFLTEGIFF